MARSALIRDSTGAPVPGQTIQAHPVRSGRAPECRARLRCRRIPSFYPPTACLSVSSAAALPDTLSAGTSGHFDRSCAPVCRYVPAGCIFGRLGGRDGATYPAAAYLAGSAAEFRAPEADRTDPLPRRIGRCYSGPTPGPDRPNHVRSGPEGALIRPLFGVPADGSENLD